MNTAISELTTGIAQASQAFAFDLYALLRDEPGNLLFSPFSISTALAMTLAGAHGMTEREMADTLHLSMERTQFHSAFGALLDHLAAIQEQGDVHLNTANSLWPDCGLPMRQTYLDLVESCYGVRVTPVNYGDPATARNTINSWVEEKTLEKIKDLLGPADIDGSTLLALVNAIYFKGNWSAPFSGDATSEAPFHLNAFDSADVPMMTQTNLFGYAQYENLQLLELPYAGGDLSMIVLLPNEVDGLAGLEAELTTEKLARWTDLQQQQQIEVMLPKFRVETRFDLGGVLVALGMGSAFSSSADFSRMLGDVQAGISKVIHQAFVDVNEEGTEAAAATAVVLVRSKPRPPFATFRADHPFLFLVRDKRSGCDLFMGRVNSPLA